MTPFVANGITGGDSHITSGQAAAIAGIATLTGGLLAGLAGQNAMAGATAAQNEALNNCLWHPESCLQMAKNTASGVWNGLVNVGEVVANIPNGGPLASPGDPGYISLDGVRLPYTPGDQVGPATAFFTTALATDGVGGRGLADGEAETLGMAGTANNAETTAIYRAVSPEEYHSIMSTGQFSFAPGAGEMKQFGFNLNEVMNYANAAPNYAAFVQAEIPTGLLGTFGMSNSIDPFIFRSGVLTVEKQQQLDLFNAVVKNIDHAY